MNTQKLEMPETISVNFTGQLVLSRFVLQELLRQPSVAPPIQPPPRESGPFEKLDGQEKLARLAYTMKETAEMLGVNYFTVHRLLKRVARPGLGKGHFCVPTFCIFLFRWAGQMLSSTATGSDRTVFPFSSFIWLRRKTQTGRVTPAIVA